MKTIATYVKTVKPEQLFMVSAMVVNLGNYLYNLILGRLLGPAAFADAAILITLLLVLSFVGMTFQLSVAKFTAKFSWYKAASVTKYLKTYALIIGCAIGFFTIMQASYLQAIFNTSTPYMFVIFGIGIPLYFILSINRGIYQGQQAFQKLSITYQLEMFCRLLFTTIFILLLTKYLQPANSIALGIVLSLLFGLVPYHKEESRLRLSINKETKSTVIKFLLITAVYEFSQIVINNSDILLVKHFFNAYDAGLYASLALIGRVVYFVAWMFVMILLPKVVKAHKNGKDTKKLLLKNVSYVVALSVVICCVTLSFPTVIVALLFGKEYLTIAPLLGYYAIATSLFAICNVFVYYFLSLEKYFPVIISVIFGLLQVLFIALWYGNNLANVVYIQIAEMGILLIVLLAYFLLQPSKKEPKNV